MGWKALYQDTPLLTLEPQLIEFETPELDLFPA